MTTLPTFFLFFSAGLLLGGLLGFALAYARSARLAERLRRREDEVDQLERLREQNEALKLANVRLEAARDADAERLAWIHTADEQLRTSFQALASQVLQQSFETLSHSTREQLEHLLRRARDDWREQQGSLRHLVEPVGESLQALGEQVRQLEKERQGAYQGLLQEVGLLRDAHHQLQQTTSGLSQALRSPTVRGRWGEVQLRRVVDMAGMIAHVDFLEQPTADGLRPDMILYLPEDGILPIDAKAPLKSYLDACAATDEAVRRLKLDAHVKAVRQRIQELGQKRYFAQFEQTPELVVMFVPNEASLAAAFERDPELLEFALQCRVLLATPITLLALLKAVAHGWRQRKVTENTREVAALGRELHSRLDRFVSHLRQLGKELDQAVGVYNQTLGSLERRVLPAVRRLEEAGAAVEDRETVEPEAIERRVRQSSQDEETPHGQ